MCAYVCTKVGESRLTAVIDSPVECSVPVYVYLGR